MLSIQENPKFALSRMKFHNFEISKDSRAVIDTVPIQYCMRRWCRPSFYKKSSSLNWIARGPQYPKPNQIVTLGPKKFYKNPRHFLVHSQFSFFLGLELKSMPIRQSPSKAPIVALFYFFCDLHLRMCRRRSKQEERAVFPTWVQQLLQLQKPAFPIMIKSTYDKNLTFTCPFFPSYISFLENL